MVDKEDEGGVVVSRTRIVSPGSVSSVGTSPEGTWGMDLNGGWSRHTGGSRRETRVMGENEVSIVDSNGYK